ncbi:MAG: type I glyceraldehyde-3-phosphate dehydrogenase [Chromatiales bacterium]|nr:type I glyceraldehyde-3-phosphate dehydrogenase [Chromatiales bacterium]
MPPHSVNIAVNGYGRIGRCIVRALYELDYTRNTRLVAINATTDIETVAYLTRHDSTHGKFAADVRVVDDQHIAINDDIIQVYCQRDPAKIPWGEVATEVLCECTGKFKSNALAQPHLDNGANKVLISAPASGDVDATVVYGVNTDILKAEHCVVSNASCTTNCLAPVAKVLHDTIGIEHGLLTTVHAYTNDQVLIDSAHKELRRARSATTSIIPTKTGAAQAVGLVLPQLAGKLHGYALRIPTLNVSLVDLTFTASRPTTKQEVNQVMQTAAQDSMAGIIAYCDAPLVSCDFNGHTASAIYDSTLTQVMEGNLVKVSAWYDNEWAYACRMIDTSHALMAAK